MSNLAKWQNLCAHVKYLHESQIESTLLAEIKKYDVKCLCPYFNSVCKHIDKQKVQNAFANLCKNKCNFCTMTNKFKLYMKIKNYGYNTIVSILSRNFLCDIENIGILSEVVENYIFNIPSNDLIEYLSVGKSILTRRTKYNILGNISEKQEKSFGLKIIKLIISDDNLLNIHEDFAFECIMGLINKNDVMSIYDIIPTNTSMTPSRLANIIVLYLIKKNQFDSIINLLPLIDKSFKLYLPRTYARKLCSIDSYLNTEQINLLLNHFDNSFDIFVELINAYKVKSRTEIIVDNKYFLSSICDLLKNMETKYLLFIHTTTKFTFITETGQVGVDAGGLTKDFYTNRSEEHTSELQSQR